jgi:FkbM family methyltransferase
VNARLEQMTRRIGEWLPAIWTAREKRRLREQMLLVEHLTRRIDHLNLGTSAMYIGNNRVLLRLLAGHHLFMMYVHADDKLITPSLIVNGRYEPELTDFFAAALKPDSHCIDVGANLGYFSCFMAKHSPHGKVMGLEPNPPIHALAVDNILLNALGGNAKILNVAASDEVGELTLYHRIGRAGNTSMAACGEDFTRAFQEPPEEAFRIPTIRVDDLRAEMAGRVDFLKIDVEGAEPLAFAGARETIRDNPQLQIVMEWAPARIRPAGFDIGRFVEDIAATGLNAHVLVAAGPPQPINYSQLIGMDYLPGILLRRDAV